MSAQKVFYALKNPLNCMSYTKKLILANSNGQVTVLLPKHIDPSKLEELLLREVDFISGVNIYGISSFPQNALRAKAKIDLKEKVDQIELSEHFHNRLPRSLSRPLLNTILELKNANFEHSYIELLNKRKDKEGKILVEVFEEYQRFLKNKDVCDNADYKRIFVDEALAPGSKIIDPDGTYIFAGFNEFSSFDLEIISTVSKKAEKTFVVSPDIINTETNYSKILKEELASLYFDISLIDDARTSSPNVYEFCSINDEVYYAAAQIKEMGGTIYAVSDVDMYYSLLRYHFGEDQVSISSAIRLDRTTILNIMTTLLTLNVNGWTHNDVIKILNFIPFWKDQSSVIKFINTAKQQLTLPRGYKSWMALAKEKGTTEILNFFKTIIEEVPLKAFPINFKDALTTFIEKHPIQGSTWLELKSIANLINRVTVCLENKTISADAFVRKLYNHAEENYVEKGPIEFKRFNTTLASLCSANTSDQVWFGGLNQEAFVEMAKEDVVMNDNFIMAYRSEGFIYPSSKEITILSTKIIQDAVQHTNNSYISTIGPVADMLKDIPAIKQTKTAPKILETAFTELKSADLKVGHKYEVLSVSLIETYMKCPYICFAERLLKTKKQEALEFELSPIDAGRLLHTALEILLPKKLITNTLDVEKELEKIFNNKDLKGLNEHPLKKVFIKHYSGIVEKILETEFKYMQERDLEIFKSTELKFNVVMDFTDGITLNGKIDRVDIDKKNNKLYVADYKTSKIPSKSDITRGEDIQLAVYIMAISKEYPGYDAYDAYYISIKRHERTELNINSVEEAQKLFAIHGIKAVNGILAGNYAPNPLNIETCESCDYRRCCGAV